VRTFATADHEDERGEAMDATTGIYITLLGFLLILGVGSVALVRMGEPPRPRAGQIEAAGTDRCAACGQALPASK